MRLILHDLTEEQKQEYLTITREEETRVFEKTDRQITKCTGCFGCWIKTPGKCVMKDGYEMTGPCLGNCTECTIVTDARYGEFSVFTKSMIDRSISAIHPYFTTRNKEMHHKLRYANSPQLTVICYSTELTDEEKETFRNRVTAMAVNLGASVKQVTFTDGLRKMTV